MAPSTKRTKNEKITKLKKDEIREFFEILKARNPSPKSDLEYSCPFTLLVAVVLSAQATDAGVNKATRKLFPVADTPQDILDLGVDGLKEYIKTIGLYNSKAENIIKLCQMLLDDHDGKVPETREELVALPGVGRKTANVVMNVVFGEPTIAVDTHVFRVSNRTGLAPAKTHDKVEDKLVKVIPDDYIQNAHHWLILHGRYVCKARKPDCPNCEVAHICRYEDKTRED